MSVTCVKMTSNSLGSGSTETVLWVTLRDPDPLAGEGDGVGRAKDGVLQPS